MYRRLKWFGFLSIFMGNNLWISESLAILRRWTAHLGPCLSPKVARLKQPIPNVVYCLKSSRFGFSATILLNLIPSRSSFRRLHNGYLLQKCWKGILFLKVSYDHVKTIVISRKVIGHLSSQRLMEEPAHYPSYEELQIAYFITRDIYFSDRINNLFFRLSFNDSIYGCFCDSIVL